MKPDIQIIPKLWTTIPEAIRLFLPLTALTGLVLHVCARRHRGHTGKLLAHRLHGRDRRSRDQQHRGG